MRCLLVDFSKAFDTVNRFILIEEQQKLDISHTVINWIIYFLSTDRTLQVVINFRRSCWLPITRSIVQGSELGQLLFLIYILDLKPLYDQSCVNTLMISRNSVLNTLPLILQMSSGTLLNGLKLSLSFVASKLDYRV